ncbi:hypothetical protein COOONC_19818, partial [Cooperia oncophora]
LPYECAETLSECLRDAATVDGSESCREAVERIASAAANDAHKWQNFFRNQFYLGPNLILKTLMGVCLVALAYFVLRLRNARKLDEKSLKYSPV